MIRDFLKEHPPCRRQTINDFIVAYFVPMSVFRVWHKWYWGY